MGDDAIVNRLLQALTGIDRRDSVKARAPKPYSQNSDFSAFLKQFENYAILVNISDDLKKQSLLNLLDASAFNAVCLLNLSDLLTYDEFAAALTSRFELKDTTDYKRIFRQCVQLPEESIVSFRDRIIELAAKAYPEKDPGIVAELAKDSFLEGLSVPSNTKELLYMKEPTDIFDACKITMKLQAAHRAANNAAKETPPTPNPRHRTCNSLPLAEPVQENSNHELELLRTVQSLSEKVEKLQADLEDRKRVPLPRRFNRDQSLENPRSHLNSRGGAQVTFAPRSRNFPTQNWSRKETPKFQNRTQ